MDEQGTGECAVAVISDIHGNRWALESVLDDINRRDVSGVVNLGDSIFGPLDPSGTAELLIALGLPTVRGNQDRVVVDESCTAQSPTLRFVREDVQPAHLKWLEGLELTTVVFDRFFLCHGTPEQDSEYLLSVVRESGVHLTETADLEHGLSGVLEPVILCGHDHVPRTVFLSNGQLIVNPGSVGLPAYSDDTPYQHVMQTGTPHARYSIVRCDKRGWSVEDIAVPYAWELASRTAIDNGRPDWATWLATGRAD